MPATNPGHSGDDFDVIHIYTGGCREVGKSLYVELSWLFSNCPLMRLYAI